MHWRDICHSERYDADCDEIKSQVGRFEEVCRAIEIAVATRPESYPMIDGDIRVGSTRNTLGGDHFPDVRPVWFAFRVLDGDQKVEMTAMTLAPEIEDEEEES